MTTLKPTPKPCRLVVYVVGYTGSGGMEVYSIWKTEASALEARTKIKESCIQVQAWKVLE
jgi:hypothetical protein